MRSFILDNILGTSKELFRTDIVNMWSMVCLSLDELVNNRDVGALFSINMRRVI